MKRTLTSLLAALVLLLCGCQGGQKTADSDAPRNSEPTTGEAITP